MCLRLALRRQAAQPLAFAYRLDVGFAHGIRRGRRGERVATQIIQLPRMGAGRVEYEL